MCCQRITALKNLIPAVAILAGIAVSCGKYTQLSQQLCDKFGYIPTFDWSVDSCLNERINTSANGLFIRQCRGSAVITDILSFDDVHGYISSNGCGNYSIVNDTIIAIGVIYRDYPDLNCRNFRIIDRETIQLISKDTIAPAEDIIYKYHRFPKPICRDNYFADENFITMKRKQWWQ